MRSAEVARNVLRSVRWSAAEWHTISLEAARHGLRPATYIRDSALGALRSLPRAPQARRARFETPRSVTLKVRLHPDELARIQRLAETLAMPTSTFVRDAAVGYRISSRADSEIIRHLARIGNNLNQLTRHAHAIQHVVTERDLAGLLGQLRKVLDTLT